MVFIQMFGEASDLESREERERKEKLIVRQLTGLDKTIDK